MKKIISVLKMLVLLLGIIITVHSCVRPDLSDCPPQTNVRIVVKTLAETRDLNVQYDIQNVTIYVFDEQHKFLQLWEGSAYTYIGEYIAEFKLNPGKYHFVVWTNEGDQYLASHTKTECYEQLPSLNELSLFFNYPQDKKIKSDVPDLLYGNLYDATVLPDTNHEFPVILTPNTYKVNFTVKGLPVNTDQFEFSATDNNSHYSFQNSIIDRSEEFEYYRTSKFTGNEIQTSIKGLKLNAERNPQFNLSNLTQSRVLYTNSIVEMIKKAYAAGSQTLDFDQTFEFDIIITFSNLGVTVTVNGWSYKDNNTDL